MDTFSDSLGRLHAAVFDSTGWTVEATGQPVGTSLSAVDSKPFGLTIRE